MIADRMLFYIISVSYLQLFSILRLLVSDNKNREKTS